ncbi:LacI family DNA-binding transcriptional regulator [Thaumasiovibrio subtropicus]|uniref:LacI family DNA-binding transcriptional regulator n=1 Tax=Thaumasiovibrio subtropicus TaxID=1891207 RepID=UPI000B3519D0|nr:LacI family DNA-binding transcriptional regulator [Thaumasiovibrio subtropicus]
MASIKDVAALAGVNRSTVSRIINGEGSFRADTKRKVEAAMAELNYRPSAIARSLATASSNMTGLLVTYYTGGFFGFMMDQVQSELDKHNKFLITAQGHHSVEGEREAIRRFHDLRCDGYILNSRHLSDDELRDLAKQPTPFVLIDRVVEGLESRCVTFDHHSASEMMVAHLIAQGHTKIGCISGPIHRVNSRARLRGYQAALKAAGITPDPKLTSEGNYGRESGYLAAKALHQANPEMTAIYSCSEEMTSGLLQYLHEQDIAVPEAISVVSFDSIDLCASYYPAISAVHFPIGDMARTAVEILNGLMNDSPIEIVRHFEPSLRLRQGDRAIN